MVYGHVGLSFSILLGMWIFTQIRIAFSIYAIYPVVKLLNKILNGGGKANVLCTNLCVPIWLMCDANEATKRVYTYIDMLRYIRTIRSGNEHQIYYIII